MPRSNSRLLLVIAGILLAACAIALLLEFAGQPQPLAPAAGNTKTSASKPQESPMQAVAPGRLAGAPDQRSSAVSERKVVGVPASGEAAEVLDEARRCRVIDNPDVCLVEEALWSDFVDLWRTTSKDVTAAYSPWSDLGSKIANQRFLDGRFQLYEPTAADRTASGGYVGVWDKFDGPYDWVTNSIGNDNGKPWVKNLRIAPGEEPEFDALTEAYRNADTRRRDAITRFLSAHAVR